MLTERRISILLLILIVLPAALSQNSCRLDEFLDSTGTCKRCDSQNVPNCNRCSANQTFQCTGCGIGHYLFYGNCKACTGMDPLCSSCQMQNGTTFTCLNCINSTFSQVTRKCEICSEKEYLYDLATRQCKSCYDAQTKCFNCTYDKPSNKKNCLKCYPEDYLVYDTSSQTYICRSCNAQSGCR